MCNLSLSLSLSLSFSLPISVVLIIFLLAPSIVVESTMLYTISVVANRDVASSLTLHVFTMLDTAEGLAQGKIDAMLLCTVWLLTPGPIPYRG